MDNLMARVIYLFVLPANWSPVNHRVSVLKSNFLAICLEDSLYKRKKSICKIIVDEGIVFGSCIYNDGYFLCSRNGMSSFK